MGEVGGIVGIWQSVVGLVVGSSSQPGQDSGQVVSAVVLHGQPAVEEVEEQFTERVAAQQPGAAHSQQQQ